MRTARPTIIAISAHDDAHLPVVQQYLNRPMTVLDPLAIMLGLDISYEHSDKTVTVLYKGRPLEDVRSVWYRKPTRFETSMLKVPENIQDYARDAIELHCALIRDQFPEAAWISPYHAIHRANNKSLGLRLASRLGMRVPDTLFTSSKELARAFLDKHSDSIVKTLARTYPYIEDKGATMFFAHRITDNTQINLDGLNLAPAIFQQAIDADYDIRATVVDGTVYASKITNGELQQYPVRDWRQGHFTDTIQFEAYSKLPDDIADKCVRLTKQLGLRFSTIDLVRDKKGEYWFLEINPNGQWAFVDEATANRIGRAIATLLSS
jgi:glutathione synthase/RimK-type ligase-like ATP-grasp enzyme